MVSVSYCHITEIRYAGKWQKAISDKGAGQIDRSDKK